MINGLTELEQQLERFPTSVVDEFRRAAENIRPGMSDAELVKWAQQGLEIAQQTVRSWEAASEYFRVSPEVLQRSSTIQLAEWGRCGSALCKESPSLAAAFFRASPGGIRHLGETRFIQGWADLGRTLYRGTWKSGALATKLVPIVG